MGADGRTFPNLLTGRWYVVQYRSSATEAWRETGGWVSLRCYCVEAQAREYAEQLDRRSEGHLHRVVRVEVPTIVDEYLENVRSCCLAPLACCGFDWGEDPTGTALWVYLAVAGAVLLVFGIIAWRVWRRRCPYCGSLRCRYWLGDACDRRASRRR